MKRIPRLKIKPETIFQLILGHIDLTQWYTKNHKKPGLNHEMKIVPEYLRGRILELRS